MLEALVAFIEDREAGKRSQSSLITSTGAVSKISEYRRNKTKPGDTPHDSVIKPPVSEICSYCGEAGHGKRSTRAIRKQ